MDLQKLNQINDSLKNLITYEKYNHRSYYYPDKGPYARDKYPKQMEFVRQSATHTIMGLVGANGSGKTLLASVITDHHLSGRYPEWWNGRRFNRGPLKAWCASFVHNLRNIQEILFGSFDDPGSGIFRKEDITDDDGQLTMTGFPGLAQLYGRVSIRHYNSAGIQDGWSTMEFKSYDQGWKQYQGATRDWIWLDEEPDDPKLYAECLARTRGPEGEEGHLLCTFAPLSGWSTIYLSFMPEGRYPENGQVPNSPEKYVMRLSDDMPHLSEAWKASMLEEWKRTDPMNILARTQGIAAMGSGKVYPVEEEFFIIHRFQIPEYYPRAYGLDFASSVGQTAALWMAQDPVTKKKIIYAEYKRSHVHDSMHVMAIQANGKWIPGICDPHSGRRDGGELRADYYRSLGLDLINGESNPSAGIAMILNDLQNGQLQIMEDCIKLISEIRTYRWDPNNPSKPAEKQDDHLLDALRYLYSKFDFVSKPESDEYDNDYDYNRNDSLSGRDPDSGY